MSPAQQVFGWLGAAQGFALLFGAFPAAADTARRVMLLILILVATAVTAMATAPAGLVLWHRLPLAPLPRAILMGYAPYLLLFTILVSLLFENPTPRVRLWVGHLDPLAFFVLINYWLRVAWRSVPESAVLFSQPAWPRMGVQVPGRVTP